MLIEILTGALWPVALTAIPLALLVGIICRFLGERCAVRHLLWLMVLLWMVVAPFLPSMHLPVSAWPVSGTSPGALETAVLPTAVNELHLLPQYLWFFGVLAAASLFAFRFIRLHRRLGRAKEAPDEVKETVRSVAEMFAPKPRPRILMIQDRRSPSICLGWHTHLVLPERLWSRLDEPGKRAMICHELAHLHRRDHWICWMELLVSILYWWHPLVWWVRRRLRAEADLCCDSWVVRLFPRHRRTYAQVLLETKKYLHDGSALQPVSGVGMVTTPFHGLKKRIMKVMTHTEHTAIPPWGRLLAILLGIMGWLALPQDAQSHAMGDSLPRSSIVESDGVSLHLTWTVADHGVHHQVDATVRRIDIEEPSSYHLHVVVDSDNGPQPYLLKGHEHQTQFGLLAKGKAMPTGFRLIDPRY